MNDRLSATLAFDGSVTAVRAVAGGRAANLGTLGIRSVRDLLTHYPRRYIDMSTLATVAAAPLGQGCTILGSVHKVELKQAQRNRRLTFTEITLVDGTGTLMITCFRQPWLADQLKPGMQVAVSGKLEFAYGYKRMTNPYIEPVESAEAFTGGIVMSVHPATGKLPAKLMRTLVGNALELCRGVEDPVPTYLRTRYLLMGRHAAFRAIHFPESMDEVVQARRRLTYEELLLLQLHLLGTRAREQGSGVAHTVDGPAVRALAAALPFELTDEQVAARDEILDSMRAPQQAHHMLLGDVGTGKTAVASFALAAAADSGGQALMMAPTEVLATQYGQAVGPLLDAAGVRWALLTGSTPASERERICAELAQGTLSVLFGTHALLEEAVAPARCTLVVVDEQQRFGVEQRQALREKGASPDVLSLTATPIPRSLALALYGDMRLSYIRHRPLSKAPTTTKVFGKNQRGDAYDTALAALEQGRQVFVVCPLVGKPASEASGRGKAASSGEGQGSGQDDAQDEYAFADIAIEDMRDLESAHDNVHAAEQEASFLQAKIFCGYQVGVLHGRMSAEQKAQTMRDFRDNIIQVLVSTTVIEVGIDVPNATVMIVEDADRFGLSQLHQLRGRVGRGQHPGTVCLVSATKNPAALERLAAMERTDDGFELAEYDLSLRREGDILGNRQHGASVLKLVNVVRDAKIIEAAHADAQAILEADPDLALPEHAALRYEISRTFADAGASEGAR